MEACIFCKIINKDIPSTIVVEDEKIIAIEDLTPQAPIHILIIPKKHFSTQLDCTTEETELLGHMLLTANKIAKEKGVSDQGFRVSMNTNDWGGQTVFHIHMHFLAGRPLSGKLG
jgi:histidine triad (HIT) family protein